MQLGNSFGKNGAYDYELPGHLKSSEGETVQRTIPLDS